MSKVNCDIAIIGAGPAGCAAALTLADYTDLRVVLIERDNERRKPGEVVPPGVGPLLNYLRLETDFLEANHHAVHGTVAAWGGAHLTDQFFLFGGKGSGWHLDRTRFESELRAAAKDRGIDFQRVNLRSAVRSNEGWRLAGEDGEQSRLLGSRFLIDAGGRASKITRWEYASWRKDDQLVAVYRNASLPRRRDPIGGGVTLIESVPDGWWYSAGLPEDAVAVAFFTDADLLRRQPVHRADGWEAALRRTIHTRRRLAAAQRYATLQIRPANSQRLNPVHGRNWIACGDAALAVDPLSSMGIGLALLTGIHAARIAAACCQGYSMADCNYSHEIERQYAGYLRLRNRFYEQESRWSQQPFWMRRRTVSADPVFRSNRWR